MSVIYTTAVKNARMDAVTAQIDSGAAAGYIEIGTSGMALLLATITLGDPSAPAAASGALTFSGFPRSDSSADATGTAAEARIRTSTGTDVVTGLTVGLSATDIILDSVSITAGQTVTLNSATLTHAA
jgi:hypothetical protein